MYATVHVLHTYLEQTTYYKVPKKVKNTPAASGHDDVAGELQVSAELPEEHGQDGLPDQLYIHTGYRYNSIIYACMHKLNNPLFY